MGSPIRPEPPPIAADGSAVRGVRLAPRQPEDIATKARFAIQGARDAGLTGQDLLDIIAAWDRKIQQVNLTESAQLAANPGLQAGLETAETVAAGLPGMKLAMSAARGLTDPETPFADRQRQVNAETSDVPVASFLGRTAGSMLTAPLLPASAIRAGAGFGAADQFLHNDPELGAGLGGRIVRAGAGAVGGAVAGAVGQSVQNGARAYAAPRMAEGQTLRDVLASMATGKGRPIVDGLKPMQDALDADRRVADEFFYGQAAREGRQSADNLAAAQAAAMQQNEANSRELARARLAAALENSDREAARRWNTTIETAPQPKPTLRDALEQRREQMAEVARRSDPQRGSQWSEPSPTPTRGPQEQDRFDRGIYPTDYTGAAQVPSPRSGVPPRTADPVRMSPMQQTAREALDRQAALRALPPEPRPGPGLGADGVKPVPVPETVADIGRMPVQIPTDPAAVQAALDDKYAAPFIQQVRNSAEWEASDQSNATLLSMTYKLMSRQQSNLGNFIENATGFPADKVLSKGNIDAGKAAIMRGAEAVSPTFPTAVRVHSALAGEKDALEAGYGATKQFLGNANPAAEKVQRKSTQSFLDQIPEMSDVEAYRASQGVLAQLPKQVGFRANKTAGIGAIPSMAHLYKASTLLNPLDEQAGNTVHRSLRNALLSAGGSATPKSVDEATAPVTGLMDLSRAFEEYRRRRANP